MYVSQTISTSVSTSIRKLISEEVAYIEKLFSIYFFGALELCPGLFTPGLILISLCEYNIYIYICNLIYLVGLRNFVLDHCPGLFTPGLFFCSYL